MVIQRAGGYCFKISSGDTTIALNPPSSKSKHKVSKFGSDVVVISVPHQDWNGAEQATHNGKEPFVVSGPGAYEVGDIIITGYATPGTYGDVMSDVGNTVYIIEMDGIRVLALGALSATKLPAEVRSEIDNIGIVLVPVGGDTLDAKAAHDLVNTIEPKAIIPYAIEKDDALKAFLKAEGATDVKATDKFTVRAKELSVMDGAVVLLS
ncbi:MAG: MBL fold metallo-hydrolase [Patescibacteria group bacterium]